MSFRSLLLAVAISIAPTIKVFAEDALSTPEVANSKYQINGIINVDSVYVRSGPGEGYYPTAELAKGAPVTVVGIKFDWLKILPPADSFSYVGEKFVDHDANSTVGKINRDDVNVRAGSMVNAMKTTVQARMNTGDEVEIIGKDEDYLKIKPPAGAYLYVKKDFVTISSAVSPANSPTPAVQPMANSAAPAPQAVNSVAANSGAIVTSTPTTMPTAPMAAAVPAAVAAAGPTTNPSAVALAAPAPSTQPAAPPPSPEELFAAYESQFSAISQQPLDAQPIDEMISDYKGIQGSEQLSDDLKTVVRIRIATLQARLDNKAKLIEMKRLEKVAADRQLALQAEQQELAERLKQSQVQVFAAVGQLQPSSLQIGGGTLYRLVDPATGRTEIYVRTGDAKITAMMGKFIGLSGQPETDPQLSLRVIEPTDGQEVDESKVNASIMADIVPPSMLARQAASN
jgi:hypothetical protein